MEFIDLRPGISVEGDEIPAFRNTAAGGSYAYLIAGVHGDEVEGVFVLQKLYEWLKKQEEGEIPLIVIPILNPDGYRTSTRTNAHGVDLNRNLNSQSWSPKIREAKYNPGSQPLSEPENRFLDELFQKFPPHFILSFHSWKPMLNYNGNCKEVAKFLERYNSYPICDDIQGHPTPGSLGDYAPEKYNCPVLTFECPLIDDKLSLKNIWEQNSAGLQALLKSNLIDSK